MADVVVPLRQATAGLPPVCAMTGAGADGAIPLPVGRSLTRWRAPVVRIPLSEAVFERWSRRQNVHIKARAMASVLTAAAIVVTFRSTPVGLSILAVAIVVHLVDLWGERGARDSQPQLERRGNELEISGVHQAFVDAIAQTPLE